MPPNRLTALGVSEAALELKNYPGQVEALVVGIINGTRVPIISPTGTVVGGGGLVYNVKDYGAVGDDVANDTAAVQAAVTAAVAGGVVYFPAGTYKITSSLELGQLISIVGVARDLAIIHYTGATYAMNIGDTNAAGTPPVCKNRVTDITIRGSGAASAGTIGIRVSKCLFPLIERTCCEQIETGYRFDGKDFWIASGHVIHGRAQLVKFGILITANGGKQVNDMTFVGGYYYGGGGEAGAYGIKLEAVSDSCKFFGTSVEGFNGAGANGWWVTSGAARGHTFIGCRSENCTVGFLLDATATAHLVIGHFSAVTDNGYANQIIGITKRDSLRYQAYAAAFAADADVAEIWYVDLLTGPITISNPTSPRRGQRLTYLFQQDAVGGRVVTFGAAFRTAWVPNTGANLRNTISFVYNDYVSLWLQTSSSVGMAA